MSTGLISLLNRSLRRVAIASGLLIDHFAALFTSADLFPVQYSACDARRLIATRADEHHVGETNRRLALDNAGLQRAWALTHVAFDDVNALHYYAVLVGNHGSDRTTLGPILPSDHHDAVVTSNTGHLRAPP